MIANASKTKKIYENDQSIERMSFPYIVCKLSKRWRLWKDVFSFGSPSFCFKGEQLSSDGGCEPCPRGTWRATGSGASCAPCPLGTTTPHPGAASPDQCSLPVCKPGKLINLILCRVFREIHFNISC